MEKPFYIAELPEGIQQKLKKFEKKRLLNEGYTEQKAEEYSDEFLNEKVYTAEEFYGNRFWEKPKFTKGMKPEDLEEPKPKEPAKGSPSWDAYAKARKTVSNFRDTYTKQKQDYDNAQRMGWSEKAKKEGSNLNPMYGLKPNNFEKDYEYQKAVDIINAYEDANNFNDAVRYLKANPFETMFSEEVKEDEKPKIEKPEVKDIDTNDNGKIEVDELDAYTKDLEDYLDKNPDAKKKNYY